MFNSVLRQNLRTLRLRNAAPWGANRFCRCNSTLSGPSSSSSDAIGASGPAPPGPSRSSTDENPHTSPYPDLMQPDVLLDSAISQSFTDKETGQQYTITIRNHPSYETHKSLKGQLPEPPKELELNSRSLLQFKENAMRRGDSLHRYPLVVRRVTQQTGKGKKHRNYMLMVVGNGNGLVGYGEGKHDDFGITNEKAYIEAVRNMDYVERFEKRTIWTNMEIKFGSTRILMRPRPVGFGLHCNPNIHQVLKAAGIKDVSAKVWGSRNPINVIKATCMLIQAGNAPLAMGNGVGGGARRLDAGSGMRSKESVELERGRRLVDGRTW